MAHVFQFSLILFLSVYYKLYTRGLMLGFDPKCVIFRDDIHVFPDNTVKNTLIWPSTLTESIRSISLEERAKFHKIA